MYVFFFFLSYQSREKKDNLYYLFFSNVTKHDYILSLTFLNEANQSAFFSKEDCYY